MTESGTEPGRRKRFGEILVEAGVLDAATLERALSLQRSTKQRLGRILEEMRVISEREIAAVLARQFGFRTARQLAARHFSTELLALVSAEQVRRHQVLPLKVQNKSLFLAMVNPLDMEAIDALAFQTGLRIVPCVTTPSEIQQAVARHYPDAPEPSAEPTATSLLVVEPQEAARRAILAALDSLGYRLLEADRGSEGLAVARHVVPHLILVNTLMPRMDCFDFLRALQQEPRTRALPVIALSSSAALDEEVRCLDAGFIDVLPTPVQPQRLRARVARALRLSPPA